MATSHHFRGLQMYAEKLMDLAEGKPVFKGRGQKPSNKKVLAEIASINKCKHRSFFGPTDVSRPCSCGWHTKAAARKKKLSASNSSAVSGVSASDSSTGGGRTAPTLSLSASDSSTGGGCTAPTLSLSASDSSTGGGRTAPTLSLSASDSSIGGGSTVATHSLSPTNSHQPRAANIIRGPVTFEPPLAPRRNVRNTRKALPLSSSVLPPQPSGASESVSTGPTTPLSGVPVSSGGSTGRSASVSTDGSISTTTSLSGVSVPDLVSAGGGQTANSLYVSGGPERPTVSLSVASASVSTGGLEVLTPLLSASVSTAGPMPPTASLSVGHPSVSSGPLPPKFDKTSFQSPTIGELRAMGIGMKTAPGKLDLIVFCPMTGKCPHCKSTLITANSVGKKKLCYAVPWPKSIVGADMRCKKCHKHFMTHDTNYVETLPTTEQIKREFISCKGNGTHISLLRMLRSGLTVAQVLRYIEDEVREHYLKMKAEYIELWDKVDAMCGIGKMNVAPRDGFPPFPSHYVPCRPHLTAMFVRDYMEHKPFIMRELRSTLSCSSLAVDHQRKVVKRTRSGDVVGQGGQSFTICGDHGLILGVYVVPDTGLAWTKNAMDEVIERHEAAGYQHPKLLYTDCSCCNGRPGYTAQGESGSSVAALWRSTFKVKLDSMHLMLRIGREMNAEHPRRKNFLVDLSQAIFSQHTGDRNKLMIARKAARLEGPPSRTERVKFIRRVVGEPESVAKRMTLVLKAHQELDRQCSAQALAAGMNVDNLTVADIAYPLITQRVIAVFQQQLIHVRNGCISDDPDCLPYVKVGTVNYHSTGHTLDHYQSLRGTSKVEAVHSVLDRTFYAQRGIGTEVFDARLGWWILAYNRRRMRALGRKVPPDSMSPRVCEHYISHGICTEFPDFSMSAKGSNNLIKIGYEYARSVTDVVHQSVEPDSVEEAIENESGVEQVVPDPLEDQTMLATSTEVLRELGLEEEDLVPVHEPSTHLQAMCMDEERLYSNEGPDTECSILDTMDLPTDPVQADAVHAQSDWKDSPLPPLTPGTPGRRRNVARRRAMGGDPACVPPNFNSTMEAVWEDLWHSMPQSSKVSVSVHSLLRQYREHCTSEMKANSQGSPLALLPVSFAYAKDWLLRKQKEQSIALQSGAVNEVARNILDELNSSLNDQPATTAELLEQPARLADPVVPEPSFSLGPEVVTESMRAQEKEAAQPSVKAQKRCLSGTPGPSGAKKPKTVAPELRERQERASARMAELGVLTQEVTGGKRTCPVCRQARTASDVTPDGKIHRVLGRSNQIWCPYADSASILEKFEAEKKEKNRANWRRANEVKRQKKLQEQTN